MIALLILQFWAILGLIALCYWTMRLQLLIKKPLAILGAIMMGPITLPVIWWLHIVEHEG